LRVKRWATKALPGKPNYGVTSRLKALDGLIIRKEAEKDISDSKYLQRHREETLLTARGEEIGWVLFDEWVYCNSPYLQVPTYFLPIVKSTFKGPDWCESLLLQNSVSAYNKFERVGVAQITDIE
jgi:hypothetical protein